MTHVTSSTNSSISSSHNEKQSEISDNQTDTLFNDLFSIVSELDAESVELIARKLSKNGSIEPALSSDAEKINLFPENITKNNKLVFKKDVSSEDQIHVLTPFIERLNSFLENRNSDDDKANETLEMDFVDKTINEATNLSAILTNADKNRELPIQKELRVSHPNLPYVNVNSNPIRYGNSTSFKNDADKNEKLSFVVKLIEDAIFSRKAKEPVSEKEADKKNASSAKLTEFSALDEAIEAVSELKNKKRRNIGLDAATSPKKIELSDLLRDNPKNKDYLNTVESKNTSISYASASAPNSKNRMAEINAQAPTRQVELSQQLNSNSVNQTYTQIIGADMHSGGDNGQDGSDNRQSSQPLRTSSPLSAIQKLDMADKAWKEALLRRVEMQIKDGGKTLDLSLNPKQLGRMTVSINMVGDDTSIQISTETSAAATLLLESESKLAQMMHDIGLRLNLLQAGLSGKNDKNSTQDESSKKSENSAKSKTGNETKINEINLNKLDKSILNIVA